METVRELAREAWSEYLAAVSRELVNAPVSIEIIDASGAPHVEDGRLGLEAVAYDAYDDVFEIAAACDGSHRPTVLRHLVDRPTRIAVDSHTMLAPMTIAVDGEDGARSVVVIQRDDESPE